MRLSKSLEGYIAQSPLMRGGDNREPMLARDAFASPPRLHDEWRHIEIPRQIGPGVPLPQDVFHCHGSSTYARAARCQFVIFLNTTY
ncbi:MAG: hypothetical protein QNJ92_06795 [Alphaproteobacteria bacterium]|nr:hypothetical protein [Alphaproteobacteria bacterium]